MTPRIKFGLIAGIIGLVINTCVSAALGICGPFTALLAGATAGFFAAQQEKATTRGDGARLGAISGSIAGALVLIGQLIGVLGVLILVQISDIAPIFGEIPSPSADIAQQAVYYISGLGTGVCFGLVGVIVAALAGAGAGYLGTPEPS